MIALLAILKVRAVAINVNYRYVAGELDYIFDNADLKGLVHDRVYSDLVAEGSPKHQRLQTFVVLPDPIEPDDASDLRPTAASCSRTRSPTRATPVTSASAARTTSTSSTPAAPPATRRASCGATRTSGGCSAAASTS